MSREYCKVTIDLSGGNAYLHNVDCDVSYTIKFRRKYNGKYQKRTIHRVGNYQEIHNVVYKIKRGYEEY